MNEDEPTGTVVLLPRHDYRFGRLSVTPGTEVGHFWRYGAVR
jgi:hypothetical protein